MTNSHKERHAITDYATNGKGSNTMTGNEMGGAGSDPTLDDSVERPVDAKSVDDKPTTPGRIGDENPEPERIEKSHASERNATDDGDPDDDGKPAKSAGSRRQVSISLRGLANTVLIVVLVSAVGILGWLYHGGQQKLSAQVLQSQNYAHAEQVAMDYAVNAATMNFQDLATWKVKLVAGTTPELKDRLTKAATSMEQILAPLQWNSTAKPLVAKVRSETAGVYVVDAFVSVLTKTVQAPDPLQSTATYSLTLDSSKDWTISDVGGIGDAVGDK